jgi:two-component system response regulator FixJ
MLQGHLSIGIRFECVAAHDKPPTRLINHMIALTEETAVIYVLDDDASLLKSVRRLLDAAGYNVEAFTDPMEFLKQAALRRPDVAVIDIRMPQMNGLEVQTRLRTFSPSTRVIILTSKDDPSIRTLAMNAGASAFLIKGVDDKEFLHGIKAAANCNN